MSQSASYSGRSSEDEERRQFFFDSLVKEETLQQHLFEQVRSERSCPGRPQPGRADHRQYRRARLSPVRAGGNRAEHRHGRAGDPARARDRCRPFIRWASARAICASACWSSSSALGKEGSLEWRIVDRFLEDLGKRRFPEIARRLGTTVDQVQRAANFIGTLDPAPRPDLYLRSE